MRCVAGCHSPVNYHDGLPYDTVYIRTTPIGTPYTRRFVHYRLAPSRHSCYRAGGLKPVILAFLVNVHGRLTTLIRVGAQSQARAKLTEPGGSQSLIY